MLESKTVKKFKADLIKTMPFFPNTIEVKEDLESQSLGSVMFHYLHWASRLIPQRVRKVTVEPYLMMDNRWEQYEDDVLKLLNAVSSGENLTEYLSEKALTKGYTVKENIIEKNDAWIDKDQLLNTKGVHHFHLKPGKLNKANVVLFAAVLRDEFKAIALFDHSVYQKKSGGMTQERRRMLDIFNHMISRELPENTGYMASPITTSGHPIHIHGMSQKYWHVVEQIDSRLGCKEFIANLYSDCGFPVPKKPKLIWLLKGLDLGVYETKTKRFFIYQYGHM